MTRKTLASTLLAAALSFGTAPAATTLTINSGGSSLAGPTYIALEKAYTKASPLVLFSYEAVGSGGGQNAFLGDNITYFQGANDPAGTLNYGTIVGTSVTFAANDAFLSASQVTGYTLASTQGPLIQIPTIGVPITIAYNEPLVTGTLTLTDAQLCGIFSGQITDWNTLVPSIPAGTKLYASYFTNSSGTSFLFSQHLNAVCNTSNTSPAYLPSGSFATTKTFANDLTSLPGNFIGGNASSKVQAALLGQVGSIGYISPDFTSIAPKSANTSALKVASLVNATNRVTYTPSVTNTELALANGGSTDLHTTPPTTLTAAANPVNWVPQISNPAKGYPIVGYGAVLLSSCYANKTLGSALIGFLTASFSASDQALITGNGFAPLGNTAAAPFAASIQKVFLNNSSGYNLNIDGSECAGKAGR